MEAIENLIKHYESRVEALRKADRDVELTEMQNGIQHLIVYGYSEFILKLKKLNIEVDEEIESTYEQAYKNSTFNT
jgi:hypothetical protein